MALACIVGNPDVVNRALLLQAFEEGGPTLVIDCANCADPHALFPKVPLEKFCDVFVIEVEIIYKLRDVLKKAGEIAEKLHARKVVVTTFEQLFDYDDDDENNDIFEHSWELMKELSESMDVVVGVCKGGLQERFASAYCKETVLNP